MVGVSNAWNVSASRRQNGDHMKNAQSDLTDETAARRPARGLAVIAAITYLLNIFDLLTTLFLVSRYGRDIEGNPFGAFLLSDSVSAVLYKVFVVGAGILLLYRFRNHRLARIGIKVCFVCYTFLFIYTAIGTALTLSADMLR